MLQFIKRIVLKLQLVAVIVAALLVGIATPVFAQMNIEITGVGQSLYPIAVMRFNIENKLPITITEIIRQNFAANGSF